MGYLGLLEAILGNLGAGGRENAIGVARIGGSGWAILGYLRPFWAILELEDANMG